MNQPSGLRTALVTGASAGIGEAFARLLAREGYQVILTARREETLARLAGELEDVHGNTCHVIRADLSDPAAPEALMGSVAERGLQVDFLVNNAGFSSYGAFADARWEDLHREVQVMVTALTELTHRMAPGMKSRGWGRVVNVSSLSAFMPPMSSLLYSGIKSYVLFFSEALHMELAAHGVHVCALCPGFTRTEFHDVMQTREATNRFPAFFWQEADAVVEEGYRAVMAGRPYRVTGTLNRIAGAVMHNLPEWLRYRLGRRTNLFDG